MEEQKSSAEQYKISGFDMRKTLEWYDNSEIEIPPSSGMDFPYPVENQELIELSAIEMGNLFALFPENARKRSILRKVVGQPSEWFHRDSTSEHQTTTTNESEAIASTAVVPSYIDYTLWIEQKVPSADIFLYKISEAVASEKVRKLVLTEGFVHEIAHSIVQPAMYILDYDLKFPDGKIVNGYDAMLHFAKLAEQHPPISHYASTYRSPNNKFEGDNLKKVNTAISEEACETIAAYLLGFAYCGDDLRGKNPFADRPEIKDFIEDFLNAELIKKEE
jgi:hypothetical protein